MNHTIRPAGVSQIPKKRGMSSPHFAKRLRRPVLCQKVLSAQEDRAQKYEKSTPASLEVFQFPPIHSSFTFFFPLIHADQTAQNSVLLINACISIMWFVCISQKHSHNLNHLHIIGCDRTIWCHKFIKLPFNSEDWPSALSIWMVILQLLSYSAEILHTILTEPHRVWFDSSGEALKNQRTKTKTLHLCP